MKGELKMVALFSAMVFLFAMPMGVYLMSFRGEGLAGDVVSYAGAFILLPSVILRVVFGLTMAQAALYGAPLLFLWFFLWVGLARWRYLRQHHITEAQ